MDAAARVPMEARFARSFGDVRVHTDAVAATAAESIGARAYTLGSHIVFGEGSYRPHQASGDSVLAHELAHVVQQRGTRPSADEAVLGPPSGPLEAAAADPAVGRRRPETPARPTIQRQNVPAGPVQRGRIPVADHVDARAQALIDTAKDADVPVAQRATRLVYDIVQTYFAGDAALVSGVRFDAAVTSGLVTTAGNGENATGVIRVGTEFVTNISALTVPHKVLQVSHELEHVRQHRRGLGGASRRPLREFLAFSREALEVEPSGTGHVQHSTRVGIIDEALRNYCLLSSDLRAEHEPQHRELLTARVKHQAASGRPATEAPDCP